MVSQVQGNPADRERATFHVSRALLEEARDVVVHLSGPPTLLTMAGLVEGALRREIARLREIHMDGHSFPKRLRDPKPGRPIGS